MKSFLLSVLTFIIGSLTVNATTYYVSASGNDANNGTSATTPWKSLSKVNTAALVAGDNILFNRGNVFYGSLSVTHSGAAGNPITFGAYGSGANPVITGFTSVSAWTNLGGNIWESTSAVSSLTSCNMVVVNGINYAMGRYPNTGYLTLQTHVAHTSITSSSLDATNWTGAEVVIRKNRSILDRSLITAQSGTTLTYTSGSTNDAQDNFGFFIQNDSRTLDQQNEWYYNTSTKKLQIYSPGSPANVQVSTVDALVTANSNINYITFSSVDFQGSNTAIIKITNAGNFTLTGCNLNFSGTDAINSSTSPYLTIQNCTISNTNNNAVYAMGYEQTGKFYGPNIVISHNAITNTGLFPGMISKTANRNGFAIRAEGTASTIEYNSIINTGFNSISFDGNSTVIRNNFINTFCLILDDGGAIYTWNNSATPHVYTGRKIQNNIIVNGVGANAGTPTPPKSYVDGIYMDDGSQGVEISGNSIANVMRNGLFLHNAHEINMHDNTVFNANHIINFQQDNDLSRIQNNTIKNNILIAKASSQLTNYYRNYIAFPISSLGVADSNYYARPVDDNMTIMVTPTTGTVTQNLSQWQSYVGMDAHSKKSPKTITDTNDLRFEYNETGSNKTISLPYKYIDVKNVTYNGSITLAPYTSAVLIKNGASTGNQAPTANAGADQSITLPTSSVSLSGSGADADGTISSYGWTKISGPSAGTITSAGTGATTVTAMAQGVYKFALKVTDNGGASASDTVQVTVNDAANVAPTVNAGADQSITLPTSSVSLSGSASDADGTISSYSWTKVSGPSAGTITSAGAAATTVTAMAQGVYKFALKVTDNDGATDFDTVQVTVNAAANVAPTANAGTDQSITLPTSSVSLLGSASDGDGTISSYSWTKVSGPSAGTITSAGAAATTVTAMAQGVYKFALKVTDNDGATDFDTVQVTVNAAANVPPTVIAGTDQTIQLPTSSVSLSGSGSDVDGTITYSWTKVSGPASGTITSSSSAATTVTGMTQGVYQFQLKVTDNNGATAVDAVQITVNAANVPPTVNAGTDQTIQLPTSSVSLSGSGSDVDGTITYSWTKVSGPASGTITNSSSAATTVTGMTQGVYQFQLKATDNNGATAVDAVQITVNAANVPPTVIAGTDQTIQLPTSSVSLSGSGSDVDGTITYSWTKVSGPASGTITNSSSAATTVTGMTQGVYQFQLKATDNNGATAVDAVQITVNAANVPPTVIAGTDQTIQLPTNSVSLSGSGSDVDGTITYSWTKVSGPASGTITNSSSAATTVTGMTQGVYQFQLKATDNNGATAVDAVQITVNAANVPPTVIAGTDQTIQLPNNGVSLTGSGSDVDGTITYSWTKVSGPASGTITNASSAATTVTGMTQGVYQFQLKATDNNGATAVDAVQITVNAANVPPTVIAGTDQTIQLPNNGVSLTGSGSDVDGTITYSWTKVSGPASGTITNSSSAATTVTGMTQGVYQFQLKATDNNGATAVDAVQITVNAANIPPTVIAGADQSITLPINNVSLSGTASDADGTISSYSWTKVSGPASGTITSSSSTATTITGMTQGVYKFALKVTDNGGAVAADTLQIIVNAAANMTPLANAGADQAIQLPTNSISLSGSGSDVDGTISFYSWSKLSGPVSGTITNSSSAATTVTGMTQGVYQFQLQVTDNSGATALDIVQITVIAANVPPTVNAGADQTIQLPINSVSLSGSSSDIDGTISSYSWTKVSGPSAGTITSAGSIATTVTVMAQGVYKFQCKVTDNSGASAFDTVQVTVNAANVPPTANAGADQTIQLPVNGISLSGSGSDVDGTINYSWTKVSGPASGTITNSSSSATTVTGMTQGVYKFTLKVTDNGGASAFDTVQVTVNAANVPPAVNAGADQAIQSPANSVSLSGSASDVDGTIASYNWSKVSGPAAGTITNASSAATTVTGITQGIYQFALRVIDNNGAIAFDTMQVTVNSAANVSPTVNAGADQTIQLPTSTVSLSGSGTDADGSISSYSWTKISGPSAFNIMSATTALTDVSGLVQGVYQFALQVTDNNGAIAFDTVQVTVNAAANVPPTVSAGTDQSITLPTSMVSLSGSATDADGSISSYSWTKVSGPSAFNIMSATTALTDVSGLVQGVYQFALQVTDNNGAIALDTVQVTVNAAANISPTVNAGADKLITLPVNSMFLAGNGIDQDGTIVSYSWTKISGPPAYNIVSASSAVTNVKGLVQGVYQFGLQVTDNNGATAQDTVQVTVNPGANIPPVVNAGSDQSITLPVNTTSLAGSATDQDGTVASYNWTKISGPSSYSIVNASSPVTDIYGLTEGVYQFGLFVTDNKGATAIDTVQVTVNAAINLPPVAYAGADQSITLPVQNISPATASLSGSGTDIDGMISLYNWTKISGPTDVTITDAASASTTVAGLSQGVYQFQLEVTDNNGATAFDTVQITVNPSTDIAPTANAGGDLVITLPVNIASLAGSGNDQDGTIANYNWTKISGPSSYNIVNQASPVTDITGLTEGVYQFELTVTDNNGAIGSDTVQVTVKPAINVLPVADAGPNQTINLPRINTTLSGKGTDADGTISKYRWTKISGPIAIILSPNSKSTSVYWFLQGTYTFQLTVTDNSGATASDTMTVTVNPGRISLNFVNMVGQLSNGKVNLTWKTTGENNITGFDIERMAANSWEKIGYTQSSNLDITGNHYNFTDNAPVTGVNSYRLNMHDVHGKSVYSDTVKFEVKQNRNIVYQNIPNPFADNTTIRYDVTEKTLVKILISDGSGMPVTLLVNEVKEPGTYQVQWNAGNLPSGNYLYTIIVGNNVTTKRMLKIK